MISNAWIRAIVVCPGCDARIEYDAALSIDLDQESDSYGRSTTRAIVDLTAPAGWYVEHRYSSKRVWCSHKCAKENPHR